MVGGLSPLSSSSAGASTSSKVPAAACASTPSTQLGIDDGETAFTQALVTIIYEYLSVGKPQAITNWLAALQGVRRVSVLSQRAGLLLWQVKLIGRAAHFLHRLTCTATETSSGEEISGGEPSPLVSAEQALSLNKRLDLLTDTWLEEVREEVVRYLRGDAEKQYSAKCAFTLVMRDLPLPLNFHECEGCSDPLSLLAVLRRAKVPTIAISALANMLFQT